MLKEVMEKTANRQKPKNKPLEAFIVHLKVFHLFFNSFSGIGERARLFPTSPFPMSPIR